MNPEMRSFAALHDADAAAATNALLLVVNAIGISVLVREYGEVHTPPSAAVGILSALFHATTKDDSTAALDNKVLHAFQSQHRSITYHMTRQELLLVFVSDAPSAHTTPNMTTKMLSTIEVYLQMLVGNDTLQAAEASKQRLALSRHVDMIDYIVKNYRKDIRLLLGRPLCHLVSECVKPQEPTCKLQQGVTRTHPVMQCDLRQWKWRS
uniref:FUZ/MON1/HPS1 first Longin domain-containing protein n=1 Tax=Globisporangium ultimum (strain ATCC 200006 / CBS 805.95 / DAOM BR144) TaxID=431595 RepID=K3X8A7_GLOUD